MKNYKYSKTITALAGIILLSSASYAAETAAAPAAAQPATAATQTAKTEVKAETKAAEPAAKPAKAAPLPLFTIEGTGGVLITPIAYLVNPGPEGTEIGLPSFGITYVNMRQKNLESFQVSETLYRRLELSFAASRFDVGSLQEKAPVIGRGDVWLYNFNARFLALEENSFGTTWLPAITLGVSGKYNEGINEINDNTAGLLDGIGYNDNYGVDFIVTGSKLFLIYGHPLILSATGRASEAEQIGYLGFSNSYEFTAEANVVFGITDWFLLAFEFRQKADQFSTVPGLIGEGDDWFTVGAAFILDPHTVLTVGYGHFGTLLDTEENAAWAVALKYEF